MTAAPVAGDNRVMLLDMDGVVLQGHGTDDSVHDTALDDALQRYGLDPDAETRALLSGHEYDTDFVAGCRRLGVDPVAFYGERERRSAKRAIERLEADTRTVYPGVSALPDLADQYALGLVSNNYDAVARFVVDHHGLDCFSHVRGRDTGVRGFYRRKPDPAYLLDALDALDGDGGIYVGDRATDVLAATRAGLASAFVRRDHNADASLPVEPTHVVGSLSALTRLD